MNPERTISFDDWIRFYFDRTEGDWAFDPDAEEPAWLERPLDLTEHFIRLHDSANQVLRPYSSFQIGQGLWSLYSGASDFGAPYTKRAVPRKHMHRAIRAVGTLVREFLPRRLSRNDLGEIHGALYMFWDITPIWPHKTGPYEAEDLDVCLSEMQGCLTVDHPTAHYHALQGLGHFALINPSRCREIIDLWLETRPALDNALREYAARARDGDVQ
ncbi:MAG: hypothetical protein AAGI53_06470 [Planctomycetota bacterium]